MIADEASHYSANKSADDAPNYTARDRSTARFGGCPAASADHSANLTAYCGACRRSSYASSCRATMFSYGTRYRRFTTLNVTNCPRRFRTDRKGRSKRASGFLDPFGNSHATFSPSGSSDLASTAYSVVRVPCGT